MRELWCWLGSNSSQLQAVASVLAVLVASALGYVAIRQARAADAQADAARAQVKAANRQIETSVLIADRQTSPNISITAATRGGVIVSDAMAILNNGSGSAKDLHLRYRDESVAYEIPLNNHVLVVRDSLEVRFDGKRGAASGFRLTYTTALGTRYAFEFRWNGNISRAVDEKLTEIRSVSLDAADRERPEPEGRWFARNGP